MYLYTDRKKKHVYRDNTKNTSVSLIERQKKKRKISKKLERDHCQQDHFLSNTVR